MSHTEGQRLLAIVRAAPSRARVVVVAHSWGADTAAQAVAQLGAEGRRVATLVTVDPVGRFTSDDFFRRVRNGTEQWTNIRATGGRSTEGSNLVAALGGPYGTRPDDWADTTIEAPFAHGNFAQLLEFRDRTLTSGWADVLGQ